VSLTKDGYIPRLVDTQIERYLGLFGAVSIEGPKWCGKTWTAMRSRTNLSHICFCPARA
jgi:hypothetical protein